MVATTETFHNVLQVIQTSCLNYRIELSPFSAIIHLKNSSIKDKNGNPIPHPMINHQFARMKLENDELSRKISQQDKTIQIIQAKSANALDESKQIYEAKENPEVKLHQTPCFSFPPPGYPIPQQCPQVKALPHPDTEYSDLYREYRELEHEFDNLETSKISLEKDLELKSKTAEDVEKDKVELQKDLQAFKTENNMLRENIKDLELDTKKDKRRLFSTIKESGESVQ
jgi:septal ring factor EnvC (AmiA/AmiB activator)